MPQTLRKIFAGGLAQSRTEGKGGGATPGRATQADQNVIAAAVETEFCLLCPAFAIFRKGLSCISHIMDQILAIPTDRKRHNQPLLCALMAVTALMLLSLVNLQAQQQGADAGPTAATQPIMVAMR